MQVNQAHLPASLRFAPTFEEQQGIIAAVQKDVDQAVLWFDRAIVRNPEHAHRITYLVNASKIGWQLRYWRVAEAQDRNDAKAVESAFENIYDMRPELRRARSTKDVHSGMTQQSSLTAPQLKAEEQKALLECSAVLTDRLTDTKESITAKVTNHLKKNQ